MLNHAEIESKIAGLRQEQQRVEQEANTIITRCNMQIEGATRQRDSTRAEANDYLQRLAGQIAAWEEIDKSLVEPPQMVPLSANGGV